MNAGAVRICETVTAATMAELRARRDAATGDLVELRLDGVADPDVSGALEGRRRPVVVTCRPRRQGGQFDADESTRLRMLADAARQGAEYVDVEADVPPAARPLGDRTRLVVSHHDFDGLPADLTARVHDMRRDAPGAIIKIAVTPACLADCLTARDAAAEAGDRIVIAMGPQGALTRLLPGRFGSCWTYAGQAAPGQFSVAELDHVYRVRRASAPATLYGVAGSPLAHSASPAMHNAAFAALDLDAMYVPFETTDLADLVEVTTALGVAGLSVTAPLKRAAALAADRTSATVDQTGAANTLRCSPDGLEADNFDVAGFLDPLIARRRSIGRAVVLGAGGAARAAVLGLRQLGAPVTISARRRDQAEALAAELQVETGAWPPGPGWDLLVNATPIGTWPDVADSPLPATALTGRSVYDVVYNPIDTRLQLDARARGLDVIGGLPMLVAQARRQLQWWTGRDVPADLLDAAARAFLAPPPSAETTR